MVTPGWGTKSQVSQQLSAPAGEEARLGPRVAGLSSECARPPREKPPDGARRSSPSPFPGEPDTHRRTGSTAGQGQAGLLKIPGSCLLCAMRYLCLI